MDHRILRRRDIFPRLLKSLMTNVHAPRIEPAHGGHGGAGYDTVEIVGIALRLAKSLPSAC